MMLAETEAEDRFNVRYIGPPNHSPFPNQHLTPGQELPPADVPETTMEAQTSRPDKRPSEDDFA